jgi:RecA-family ATPase
MMNEIKITKAIDIINEAKKLPDPIFIWKGIPEGSKGLLTGVAKTGKTTFAENLAISLSVGRKEFFTFEMDGNPRKVLFINLEEKFKFWARRQSNQLKSLTEIELQLFKDNYFCTPVDFPSFFNDEEDWNTLKAYIERIDPEVVIIDSLSHLCIGEIERSSVAQAFVQKFRQYIESPDRTIIIIHHNTKGNQTALEMDKIAGSRIISQEFEYAFSFANIPGSDDQSYMSMVFNKHVPKENSTSYKYKFGNDGWVQNIGVANKYEFYNSTNIDYRTVTGNKDKILNSFISKASQDSQGSQTATMTSSELLKCFVDSGDMSKQTMYANLKALIADNKITKNEKGCYEYLEAKENE